MAKKNSNSISHETQTHIIYQLGELCAGQESLGRSIDIVRERVERIEDKLSENGITDRLTRIEQQCEQWTQAHKQVRTTTLVAIASVVSAVIVSGFRWAWSHIAGSQ